LRKSLSAHRRCGQTRESALQKCGASPIQKSACFFLLAGRRRKNHESMATKSISLIRGPRSRRRHTLTVVGSPSHLCNNIGKRECVCVSLSRSFYLCGRDAAAGADSPHHHRKASERSAHMMRHKRFSPLYFGPVAPKIGTGGKVERRPLP
jgi:hypothetical protein